MEEWWKTHASHENDPEWHKWINRYLELYKTKADELLSEHSNTVDGIRVFGASKAGGPTRATGLSILGYEKEPFSGSTNFTFWLGHTVEIAALATLEAVGYPIIDTQPEIIIRNEKGGPIIQTKSDAMVKILGEPTIVSIKSSAYKMSGQRKGTWIRQGFASLPFEGVRKSQPNAYAQAQVELYGSGLRQCLIIYAAKDIVKAFENDDYLGAKGNGSLTFYAEMIKPDLELTNQILEIHDAAMDTIYEKKEAGPCYYLRADTMRYVELERANVQPSNIWGGKNKEITGTFNPCGGCQMVKVCKDAN